MSAPESDDLSSDGNAGAESHSPAATWQMWHTQMLRLGQQPSERKRRARHAFVGLVPLVSMLVTATILAQSAPLAQFDGSLERPGDHGPRGLLDLPRCGDRRSRACPLRRYCGLHCRRLDHLKRVGAATISRGSNHANVQGHLGRGTGFGRWSIAGCYDCSGHWTEERRESGPGPASGEE
jgi:hypothetical protein